MADNLNYQPQQKSITEWKASSKEIIQDNYYDVALKSLKLL